jgi:hypothetical protein
MTLDSLPFRNTTFIEPMELARLSAISSRSSADDTKSRETGQAASDDPNASKNWTNWNRACDSSTGSGGSLESCGCVFRSLEYLKDCHQLCNLQRLFWVITEVGKLDLTANLLG